MNRNENVEKVRAALLKPLPDDQYSVNCNVFDPWHDVLSGIYGGYASASDILMIEALQSTLDRTTFEMTRKHGFVFEFALYVLAGHGLTEYGTSPRGGWPEDEALTRDLIAKWKAYYKIVWAEDYPTDISFTED